MFSNTGPMLHHFRLNVTEITLSLFKRTNYQCQFLVISFCHKLKGKKTLNSNM